MIYLASPYNHKFSSVREARYLAALDYSYHQILRGVPIFSPIVHCHHMALRFPDSDPGFNFWREYNIRMLHKAWELHVLKLPGWKESEGVKFEIWVAEEAAIPITFVEPIDG